jgi:SRSO17 transposase
MGLPGSSGGEARFSTYVEGLTSVIGHADRAKPLRDYCLGLMMPCGRKSVEPMAAITAPERTAAQHQSLLHFVGEGKWSDEKVLAKVRELVLPKMERHGPIEAWIIDDTGFPKKGQHSVGVARQYCGELGKQDNCQVAVTLSIANHDASLPVAYQLYLPKDWASDRKRRRKVGIPDEFSFKTKPEIALGQIRRACEAGLPRGVVLMDAGYGVDTNLRKTITTLGLSYVAGIQSHTTVWAPGSGPQSPKKWSGRGRPPKLLRVGPAGATINHGSTLKGVSWTIDVIGDVLLATDLAPSAVSFDDRLHVFGVAVEGQVLALVYSPDGGSWWGEPQSPPQLLNRWF